MEMSEEEQRQRAEELAKFYAKHQPRKVRDAKRLVESFEFEDIRRALMRKYGTLPAGWNAAANIQLKTEIRSFETKLEEAAKGVGTVLTSPSKPKSHTVFNIHVRAAYRVLNKNAGPNSPEEEKTTLSQNYWIVQKRYSELRLVHHLLRECSAPNDAPFPPAIPSLLINDVLLETRRAQLHCVLHDMVNKRNNLKLGIKCGLILDSFIQLDRHCPASVKKVEGEPSSSAGGVVVLQQPAAVGGNNTCKKGTNSKENGIGADLKKDEKEDDDSDMLEFWGEIYSAEIDLGKTLSEMTEAERRLSHCSDVFGSESDDEEGLMSVARRRREEEARAAARRERERQACVEHRKKVQLHMKYHLENQMIEWKQKNADGKFVDYIREVCPENVKLDDSGSVVWVDERLQGPKWKGAFDRLHATDELHELGDLPLSDKEIMAQDQDSSGKGVSIDAPANSGSPSKFWAEIYGVYGSELEKVEGVEDLQRRRSRCSDVFGSSSDDDEKETAAQRRRRRRREKGEESDSDCDSAIEPTPSAGKKAVSKDWGGMFGFW